MNQNWRYIFPKKSLLRAYSNLKHSEGEIVPLSIACHVIQVTRFKPLKTEYYTNNFIIAHSLLIIPTLLHISDYTKKFPR